MAAVGRAEIVSQVAGVTPSTASQTQHQWGDAPDELLVGPVHGELLGAEYLAGRAREVARSQRIAVTPPHQRETRLLARLLDTRQMLADAERRFSAAAATGIDVGPAADWLMDNLHVVQEHLQEVRASLPRGYYRELPELLTGPLTGYPRVYEVAISLISHTESRIDLENVDLYVEAFQSVTVLSLGELWAMPAMLRLGLIESVRRMTIRTMQRLDELELAQQWAARIVAGSTRGGSALRSALHDFTQSRPPLTPTFLATMLQLIRRSEGASMPLTWLEQWMREAGAAPEQSVAQSSQHRTLTQMIMANSILSLRDIGRRNWRLFVEHQSAMDAILRTDPTGEYVTMTSETQDSYRRVIERIAKQTGARETVVASWAIALARREHGVQDVSNPRMAHVGYYLVSDGVSSLERRAGYVSGRWERLRRGARAHPEQVLTGSLVLVVVVLLAALRVLMRGESDGVVWILIVLAGLPALDIAVTVRNQILTAWLPPSLLPRIELQQTGVPEAGRTLVVCPLLLCSEEDVRDALEKMEVRWVGNHGLHVHFAIVSDFSDANSGTCPTDDRLLKLALDGVRELNARHHTVGDGLFHLLHRARRWNAQEGVWMGWERKRGKLVELNQWLRGAAHGAFDVTSEEAGGIGAVRYVITVDADTFMPPDTVTALVGTMMHPLNRAVYDHVLQRVVRGYGILQPRVEIALESAHRTRFSAMASGHPGVDPYSTVVSDVYQDLYDEGSYTGKGIYDVDVFQQATQGWFADDTVLSHDLIEGAFARSALVTDVPVYDEYPSTYVAHARRSHRWIRGDWQLMPWLRRRVQSPTGRVRNPISMLSRWKLLDNLRRSLTEIALVAMMVGGWILVRPESVLRWTVLSIGAVCAPLMMSVIMALVRPPREQSWRAYYVEVMRDAGTGFGQACLLLVFLPNQAALSLDAIARTVYRVVVTHTRLLEWESSSVVERSVMRVRGLTWQAMRRSVMGVGVVATGWAGWMFVRYRETTEPLAWVGEAVVPVCVIMLLWALAPEVAIWLSRPSERTRYQMTDLMRSTAQRYAAQHWQFFAQFTTEQTGWLAPDNFQSDPAPVVAMRTSPTNMGLQLLSIVSACDLGLISVEEGVERLEKACRTLQRLQRYRGHFYNWYELHEFGIAPPAYISAVDSGNLCGHLIAFRQACLEMMVRTPDLGDRLQSLAGEAERLVREMDFSFLYDTERKLFTIGYHTETCRPDASCYDLLASEARLLSFVAIAKGDVPVEHWFRLSRVLSRSAGGTALVSWSGSMFEYLMPLLVMRTFPATLLDQTYQSIVAQQRLEGRRHGVPWGMSESAYNLRDREETYQYRAFGVAHLALKRGLARDVVIAPYATALAAMVNPVAAFENLRGLEEKGALGDYGFVDALDYTRHLPGRRYALVHTYMAHHVGMTMVSLTNLLKDNRWQERFHADPLVKSVAMLLQERVPRRLVMQQAQVSRLDEMSAPRATMEPVVREINTMDRPAPRLALLGSAPYTVLVNQNGSGLSQAGGIAVNRWRADETLDDYGQYCYVKDLSNNRVWSVATQPLNAEATWSQTRMEVDRVTFQRADGPVETSTEITVVASDAAEVRRVTLTNKGLISRDIELTSYAEMVLAPLDADRSHPVFSNLFVETEWHAWCGALSVTRRTRTQGEPQRWCAHVIAVEGEQVGEVSCETDRARFLGRGRTVHNPLVMETDGPLSGTTGAVLDPVVSLRVRVRLGPGKSARVTFTTLVSASRDEMFARADRYHESHAATRALDFAWASTQLEMRELDISPTAAALFQDLATQVVYPGGVLSPAQDELRRNRSAQPTLWAHGISGSLPMVLAVLNDMDGLSTFRELCAAHRFWRDHGLPVDLVVVNGHPFDYFQEMREGIKDITTSLYDVGQLDARGGVFVRTRESFSAEDYGMLAATSRLQILCDGRTLRGILEAAVPHAVEIPEPSSVPITLGLSRSRRVSTGARKEMREGLGSVERRGPLASFVSALLPLVPPPLRRALTSRRPRRQSAWERTDLSELQCYNGIGGLDEEGEYVMDIDGAHLPPAPWSNVIANAHGGFQVTERGSGCTWAGSAYFFRLTPWHNDPVSDPSSDTLFLKEEDSGAVWCPTPGPVATEGGYRVRHGAGHSVFEHVHDDILSVLELGMPDDAAVKVSQLRLTNQSDRVRRITMTAFAEWTLGAHRDEARGRVRTRCVPEERAIFAQNTYDAHFADWTAFLSVSDDVSSYTADRQEFMGRHGVRAHPAGIDAESLDGRTGVGLDPCAALRVEIELPPGGSHSVTVLLGAMSTEGEARRMLFRLRTPERSQSAVGHSKDAWKERLGVIRVTTPDSSFDAMVNHWTLYQALSCRVWARMGLYQSSGAYGFRDQLQDVMALVYAEPHLARAHILRAAARQFVEGDVQHWWHPHSGRGVRTRMSDDLAWLPFVVEHYVRVTGDETVLDEYVPFLSMRPLEPSEHEVYDLPTVTDEHGTLYEHCRRALRRACTSGARGLPLMGTGDWNDGMNRVGAEGLGESVWLGWFLITTLRAFEPVARQRGDIHEAQWMGEQAVAYTAAVEAHGWDGQWYRRAFYDDGTPLGAATGDECRIDSIAQSWSVISGAGGAARQDLAMRALNAQLVMEEARLLVLLRPPFDRGAHDPGYIKGYLPGVRENGAQYTHAALWVVLATALRGNGDRAFELFQMLNPLTHSDSEEGMRRYKVEPYVVAADVYTAAGQMGRGGWTWYTGSASWMYRVALESLLGFTKHGNTLRIKPRVPRAWPQYAIDYRFGRSVYRIEVRNPSGIQHRGACLTVDGVRQEEPVIHLIDDGRNHLAVLDVQHDPVTESGQATATATAEPLGGA